MGYGRLWDGYGINGTVVSISFKQLVVFIHAETAGVGYDSSSMD